MPTKTFETPKIEIINDEQADIGLASRVALYNDDWHSFDEVIVQLIKATRCTFEKARSFAFEVHVKGKAIVFSGSMQECLKVSSILEEIALHTEIQS
ncbi:MAG TPA: ATP-dependent Clp protease adaptor ClpS [Ignavibacteriaceae bacterium]|nr:ATP-dependent Clp protease adaptor ClpS [Ignavibacteriaceae bacterium]